jgi:hypothetical protein
MRQAVRRGPEPRTATPDGSGGTGRGVRRRFRCRPTPAVRWPRWADTDCTAGPPSRDCHRQCVRPPVNSPGWLRPRRTRPPQRRRCRWPLCARVRTLTGGAAHAVDTGCPQRGRRTGRCPLAQRPAAMTVEAAAEGPQRFRPGGGNGTGCRTPDRSRSHPAWTPCPPAGRRGRTGQGAASIGRTVNPPVDEWTTSG